MNAKLLLKTLFLIVVLLFLVVMGMHNEGTVTFSLPPFLPSKIKQPAALMYFAFFGVGVLTGIVVTPGGSRRPAPPLPGKPEAKA